MTSNDKQLQSIDPEIAQLVTMIDRTLSEISGRNIVSTSEMADLLLDIRSLAMQGSAV